MSIGGLTSPTLSPGHVKESPLLLNEIKALRSALTNERRARGRLQADNIKKLLQKMEPLPVSFSKILFSVKILFG